MTINVRIHFVYTTHTSSTNNPEFLKHAYIEVESSAKRERDIKFEYLHVRAGKMFEQAYPAAIRMRSFVSHIKDVELSNERTCDDINTYLWTCEQKRNAA